MNLYQEHIYRSHLEHAMPMNPRKNHKYLYIDKNGNYVYPEDVKRKASGVLKKAGQGAKTLYEDRQIYGNAAKDMANDYKNYMTNKKYRIKDEMRTLSEDAKAKTPELKEKAKKIGEGAKKVAKGLLRGKAGVLYDTGSTIYKAGKEGVASYKKKEKARQDKLQKDIDKSAKESNEKMAKSLEAEQDKYIKKKTKEQVDDYLPEGWERKSDGYIYDDLGAIVSDAELAALRKKQKKTAKK